MSKWARQARTAADVFHELRRALYLTDSVPRGPTLLEIPFDLLLGDAAPIVHPLLQSSRPTANADEIKAATDALASAETPLIIAEYVGRTADERQDLVRVAEALGAPVFEFMSPAFRTFPRNHPLHGAGAVEPVVGEADAILVAGCNAPWHPPLQALKPGCRVIHLEEDPLRPRAPPAASRECDLRRRDHRPDAADDAVLVREKALRAVPGVDGSARDEPWNRARRQARAAQ